MIAPVQDRSQLARFDPYGVELLTDPYAVYTMYRLRDPVHLGQPIDPRIDGTYYLFSYDAVSELFRLTSSRPTNVGAAVEKVWPTYEADLPPAFRGRYSVSKHHLQYFDWPEHMPRRRPIARRLGAKHVRELELLIRTVASDLITEIGRDADYRGFDLIRDFAHRYPLQVIAAILNVPDTDLDRFHQYAHNYVRALDLKGDLATLGPASQSAVAFREYFAAMLRERRSNPGSDLISALAHDPDVGALGDEYLAAMCTSLTVAGFETTQNLIGTGMFGLLCDGGRAYKELVADFEGLIGRTVEEMLRWASPTQRVDRRWAYDDMTICGVEIPGGSSIQPLIGAANHDPAMFSDPDVLDIRRENAAKHVALGAGVHLCVGGALARSETRIALELFAELMPGLRLRADAPISWASTFAVRGLTELAVEF